MPQRPPDDVGDAEQGAGDGAGGAREAPLGLRAYRHASSALGRVHIQLDWGSAAAMETVDLQMGPLPVTGDRLYGRTPAQVGSVQLQERFYVVLVAWHRLLRLQVVGGTVPNVLRASVHVKRAR